MSTIRTLNSINISGLYKNIKPKKPKSGQVYYDESDNRVLVYQQGAWVDVSLNTESYYENYKSRECVIDGLLDNDEFDPEYFGFEKGPVDFKYTFHHENDTYEVVKDNIHSDIFIIRCVDNYCFDALIYYRGKIPNNKFALELFKNMNFGFLPIVHREIKIADLLD